MSSRADSNIEAIQSLLKGTDILIKERLDSSATLILTGVVTNVDRGENTYTVSINENSYEDIPSIADIPTIGLTVKVVVPQGQYGQMFILGYIH